jgi:hypothetical protein
VQNLPAFVSRTVFLNHQGTAAKKAYMQITNAEAVGVETPATMKLPA